MQTQNILLTEAAVGECTCGFRLEKKEYVAAQQADLYTLRHEKTGAALIYFERKVENKTFAITFETLPEDDTGVFHILEHSVLNGSDKFPVKEPFVSMLQGSMQTYLNAITFPDKTVYPVSSRNEQDFFNLMEVYLDAVFRPRIYERPEIFQQEGWHYEFAEDGTPSFNGVVYSEMKGAYANVDRIISSGIQELLFPDNCYGFCSGGRPAHITDLTYEGFLAAHRRFYHPSNARIFLDGAMDIQRALRCLDEGYLCHYDRREADFSIPMQVARPADRTVFYETAEGEAAHAHMAVAKLLCAFDETETLYAAKILSDYLAGSNEAPLKRAFLERGLGQDVDLWIEDGLQQNYVSFLVRNTEEDRFDEIRTFLPQAVKEILARGLEREGLSASLERFAFNSKCISEPYGIVLALRALNSWLYGGDPLTHIDNGTVFDSLRQKLDTTYFSDLLRRMLGTMEGNSCLYVLPSQTKGAEDAAQEAKKATDAVAAWSEETRQAALAQAEALRRWQQSTDTPEALATLPHLNLADIPLTIPQTPTRTLTLGQVPALAVDNATNGINYVNLYFNVSDLSQEDLLRLNALTACMGELSTAHLSATTLQTKIKGILGSLSIVLDVISQPGDTDRCETYLVVSASMLQENAAAGMELLVELMHGRYDEVDRMEEIFRQSEYYLKQSLISDGHSYAISKALAPYSQEGAVRELLDGETFQHWFRDFIPAFHNHLPELEALTARVFVRSRLFIGFGGAPEEDALLRLVEALPQGSMGPAQHVSQPAPADCTIAIPSAVGFSALGHNLYVLGEDYKGAWSVLASLLSYGYLWNAVRVQGGAYGTGMSARRNGDLFCYSYRDPDRSNTRTALKKMADFLEDHLAQTPSLDDIIIGTVNSTDPLLSPGAVCKSKCFQHLTGSTPAYRNEIRRQILQTTPEDLRACLSLLRTFGETGTFCTVE